MANEKLTKKQKKALAFRERKGKGKAKATDDTLPHDVPIIEDQDLAEVHGLENQEVVPERMAAPQEKVAGRKRKRESSQEEQVDLEKKGNAQRKEKEGTAEGSKTTKKRKGDGGEAVSAGVAEDGKASSTAEQSQEKKQGKKDAKQRFILFVGNLKYSTTKEAVEQHFASCDPPPQVRLMTSKPSPNAKATAKSKGFAFLEFAHKKALQQALKLHLSELDGRKINVELTAGGGGKSEHRVTKLKERNKELHEQRKKRLAKQKSGEAGVEKEGPQRYSATSGIDEAPKTKRTWSVPDGSEENPKKKRGSKSKKPARSLGTGVNAIPVG